MVCGDFGKPSPIDGGGPPTNDQAKNVVRYPRKGEASGHRPTPLAAVIDRRLNLAKLGAVLTAVKAEPPLAVALPLVGPALTAAARGATRKPGRDGETVLRSNKETSLLIHT